MKLKRFAAGFIAAVMAFAVLGTPLGDILPFVRESVATTAGAETYTYGDFEYSVLDDGTVEISRYRGNANVVDIPASINGKRVTSIGDNAFNNRTSLTNVTIPDSVTSIGDWTFHYCPGLTSITIPDSVTRIGKSVFYDCRNLTRITMSNSVMWIGEEAFNGCNRLTSITIPNSVTSIGEKAFYRCLALTAIYVAEANKYYSSLDGVLFNKDKTELICYPPSKVDDSYNIPNSVKSIGNSAFEDCKKLTNIKIPDSVTCIGNRAFGYCTNLSRITIPDSVTYISGYTFYSCKSLKSITIPDSVTSIGKGAFAYCASLTRVEIPNSVASIGEEAFEWCESLTSITIPDGVTSIGWSAFWCCLRLKSITIPNSVTSISEDAFHSCTSLKSITIPSSVTRIGNSAFCHCSSLTSITIPSSVTSIGEEAFSGCKSLASITIPDGVKSIGGYAFYGCSSLTSIALSDSMTSIEKYTFYGCSSLKSITIPGGVTSIGKSAFLGCESLTSITIPSSVTSIGNSAFSDCNSSFVIRGNTNSEAERYAKDNNIIFKSAGYSVPVISAKSSYNIKIVDNNGNPIKNATISVDTISRKATGGFASISFPSAERIWKVSADKYVDKYISANELTTDVNTIIMYPVGVAQKCYADKVYYSEKSDIDTVYTNGNINNYVSNFQATEVLTGAKTIDLVRKEYGIIKNYDFYLYCASDSNENATYEVYDGNKRLTTSSTKKIKLSTSMLNESSSLLIVEKFSDGSRNHYGVNLKAVDNKVSENSFELSTGSVSIAPSDDLSWLGSWNIDVPSFPLYAKCTGDEIRIGVGVTKDVLDSDSKFFDYKDSFDKLKDSRKNASPLLKAKSLAKLKSKYIKSNGKTKLPGLKDGFDLTIVGCGYAKIQPGQDTYTLGINVIVTADYSVTLSHQFFVGVIPVTVNIKAGASVEGNFDMSWVKNGNSSGFANNTVLELTVEPYFKPYAGIGIDKVANVGVYGSLAMPIKITFISPDKNAKGVNSVDIKGEAGLRANVLWFTYNYTIFKGSRNLYTKPQSMMTATIEQRIDVLNSIAYAAQSQQEPIEEIFDIDNYDIVKKRVLLRNLQTAIAVLSPEICRSFLHRLF